MTVELTPAEHDLVTAVLQQRTQDLQREIFHTDRREFKRVLEERLELMEQALQKFQAAAAACG
jgi:hypothetical protein